MRFTKQQYPIQDGNDNRSITAINENHKLYYHRLGKQQDKDVLVAEFPEHPQWIM